MSIQLDTMPKLGFGLMRLPEKEGKIDIEHVCHYVWIILLKCGE